MAGWKLRKDKTQADTAATESQDVKPSDIEAGVPQETEIQSALASHTDGDTSVSWEQNVTTPAPDFEAENGLRFEEDEGPLTLVDYSESDTTPVFVAPPPLEIPVAEQKSALDSQEFTSTLRMNREELAGAFTPPPSTGLPTVPPFVLDAPLVTDATQDTPPRLVVRVGRLSGAFDLTKDVTTIGRPDTALHYYPDVEIELDDAVSRRHAEVLRHEDSYSIVDSGSTNGTLLNGEKLPPHEERLLTHGDRIRVGERTEIIFE